MTLLDRLRSGEILIGDGAWGTMLMARGLAAGQPPERWTLERPDALAEIALLYVAAGANLITTNTFGASPLRLRMHGLDADVDRLNARAVAIAREAVGGHAYVSASVGPTGHLLAPLGDAQPDEVYRGYVRQIAALAEAGADAICIETMTDVEEAALAVRAARATAPQLPVLVSMSFEVTRRGAFTVMGVSPAMAVARLGDAGADVIGANCGTGPEAMRHVADEFAGASGRPAIFQPNAGLPEQIRGDLVYPQGPDAYAQEAAKLAGAGGRIVGGCCGTTPEHIRALARAIRERSTS